MGIRGAGRLKSGAGFVVMRASGAFIGIGRQSKSRSRDVSSGFNRPRSLPGPERPLLRDQGKVLLLQLEQDSNLLFERQCGLGSVPSQLAFCEGQRNG